MMNLLKYTFLCLYGHFFFIVFFYILTLSLQSISPLQIKRVAERYKALRLTDEEVKEM